MQILQLDVQGQPQNWISPEDAAGHYATESVVWTVGDPCITLRGGVNARSGLLSRLDIHPIIALKGTARVNLFDCVPTLTNAKLFVRDRFTCAYCLNVFSKDKLTRDHIIPRSKGGADNWQNCCTSCVSCNTHKSDKLLEKSGMKLGYMPYVPSLYEDFILKGRNIRADVHEWLAAKLPKGSRLA